MNNTQAIQRLLVAYKGTSASRQSVDSLGVDLWHSMSWRTSNLSTATLDSVISAGHLDIVRDQPLRAALAVRPVSNRTTEQVISLNATSDIAGPTSGTMVVNARHQ
jgi:hypothetical protein